MIKFEIVSRGQLSISSPASGYFNYTQRHVLLSERCCESAKEFSEKCISLINKIPEAKSFSLSKSCLINSEESWDVRKKCEWFVQYFSRKFAFQLCNKLSGFHQRNVVSFKKKLGNYKIFLWMIFQILMQLSNFSWNIFSILRNKSAPLSSSWDFLQLRQLKFYKVSFYILFLTFEIPKRISVRLENVENIIFWFRTWVFNLTNVDC